MRTSNTTTLVDQLGDTRARLAALERRDAELRQQISELGIGEHRGTRWTAVVKIWRRSRIDAKALRARHPAVARECTIRTATPCVRVKAETVEGAL
jgi:hypothetical protein